MSDTPPPDDSRLVETKLDSERVFDGRLLHVRRDTVHLPSGRTATREYIVHPGAVLIAPRLPDGCWIVERQFRYPVGRVFLEFPAGKRDPGESALETGKRELAEEAGYEASTWTRLGVVHPCIGYSDEAIELWRADGLVHVGSRLDEDENLDVLAMSGADLLAALDRGEITDAKTVAALLFLERNGGVA